MELLESFICEDEEVIIVGERSLFNLVFRFLIFCPFVFIGIYFIITFNETIKYILSEPTNIISILVGIIVIIVNCEAFFDSFMSDIVITNKKTIVKKLRKIHIIHHESIKEVELFKTPLSFSYRWLSISSEDRVYIQITHLTTESYEEIETTLSKYKKQL